MSALPVRRRRRSVPNPVRRVAQAMFAGFAIAFATVPILWAVVITLLGYLFGQSLPLLVKWVGRTGTILLIAAIVIGIIAWRIQRHRKSND